MSEKSENPKIAIIHDEFVRRGGAEIVVEELLRLYPQSDVYALYASNTPRLTLDGHTYTINTSFLQRLPLWFRQHPGRLLPLLPQAAEQFDFSSYDVVISSASGFAKGIITRSNVPHVCYCHTPTRYLWDASYEVASQHFGPARWILKSMQHYLRMTDFAAAQRPDKIIANSTYTQQRIQSFYRRESTVCYPPIDTSFFTPRPSEKLWSGQAPFLLVGRLSRSKHFEQAIQVCRKLQYPLVVVGTGYDLPRLKKMAGRRTEFVGKVSRQRLRSYYRQARALIQPGIEDFGMAAAQALSCGTPVVALGKGGVLEIVHHGQHGWLYKEEGVESLAEALRQFARREQNFRPEVLQRQALTFSVDRFRQGIQKEVDSQLASRNNT